MTPGERLKEIEDRWKNLYGSSAGPDVEYLLKRVKGLTKIMEDALEKLALNATDTANLIIKALMND